MARQVDGIGLGALFAGSLFMYAGLKGISVPHALQAIVQGKGPQKLPVTNPISGTPASSSTGGINLVSSSGYANPFSQVQNLTPERVDQGVDFGGTGPILAIGSGKITSTVNFGWPGNAFICIHLDSGAYAGKYVYFAENISPSVKVGQHVNAGDVIGVMTGGIECGWAAPPGLGASLALVNLQFTGSNTTAYGASFNNLLTSLGVPSGQINNTPTGSVGAGFPPPTPSGGAKK